MGIPIFVKISWPFLISLYSQTCIKRSPLGQEKGDLSIQVTA